MDLGHNLKRPVFITVLAFFYLAISIFFGGIGLVSLMEGEYGLTWFIFICLFFLFFTYSIIKAIKWTYAGTIIFFSIGILADMYMMIFGFVAKAPYEAKMIILIIFFAQIAIIRYLSVNPNLKSYFGYNKQVKNK